MTQELFIGPWAGLPVAWTKDDRFDEATFRGDVERCCQAGMPGVYTGGTTGEFYAMDFDEFREVARATVEECHANDKPAMIGCSSTYTRGSVRCAEFAAELGADAMQVTLPFWMEVAEKEIVPFFKAVSDAAGGMPLSVYETKRCKVALTIEQHRAIKEAVPNYLMVKSNVDTIGVTPEGCEALSEIVNVFVGENLWAKLAPFGARGGCSSKIYWSPKLMLNYWADVQNKDFENAGKVVEKMDLLQTFLRTQYAGRGFTDTAIDRLGGLAGGFLKTSPHSRAPYPSITDEDIEVFRNWCQQNFPEMLYSLT